MNETLNVAIVGYGYAAKTFHAPLIAGVAGLELAAIVSSDPAKVRADWPEVVDRCHSRRTVCPLRH